MIYAPNLGQLPNISSHICSELGTISNSIVPNSEYVFFDIAIEGTLNFSHFLPLIAEKALFQLMRKIPPAVIELSNIYDYALKFQDIHHLSGIYIYIYFIYI